MRPRRYAGYRSFQYLEPGVDYRPFALSKEIGRVEPYTVGVSTDQEERTQRLLDEHVVISLHEHAMVIPEDAAQTFPYIREGRTFTGYEGLSVSGLDAFVDFFLDGLATITSRMGWKWTDVVHDIGMRFSDIAHQDFVIPGLTVGDITHAHETGRVAFIAGLESAMPIENELDRIDVLYGLGIRILGIAYSEGNALGAGHREQVDGGLTDFGRRAVARMNKIGMAVDLSHAGHRTGLETIQCSTRPVFISHTGVRGVWPTRLSHRPDEVLKACAERGGLIGIISSPNALKSKEHPEHTIETVMDHFEYAADLVGIDHVTFGPDTMFGDHVGLSDAWVDALSRGGAQTARAMGWEEPMVRYVKGMENPAECFPNIVRWLVAHAYSDDEIAKVIGGNTLRVLREVWAR